MSSGGQEGIAGLGMCRLSGRRGWQYRDLKWSQLRFSTFCDEHMPQFVGCAKPPSSGAFDGKPKNHSFTYPTRQCHESRAHLTPLYTTHALVSTQLGKIKMTTVVPIKSGPCLLWTKYSISHGARPLGAAQVGVSRRFCCLVTGGLRRCHSQSSGKAGSPC